jgi:hypothetical protein
MRNPSGTAHLGKEQSKSTERGQQFTHGDVTQMGHGSQNQSPGYRTVADGQGHIQKFCESITHSFPTSEICKGAF